MRVFLLTRGELPWMRAVAALILVCTGGAGLGQSSATPAASSTAYGNLVTRAFLKRAREVSQALSQARLIPAESFSNATVELEGQSSLPSGSVRSSCCEYNFRHGLLQEIRRLDLFVDKGPDSLILQHLTNEVLTLTLDAATNRALEVLRLVGYDADRIRASWRMRASDDLMDAHPIRNAGPNFPQDLHFFGELISRKKIRMMVGMAPVARELADLPGANARIEFLATTGELLEAMWLPNAEITARIEMRAPEQIRIAGASDFAPPVFVSATRKLAGGAVEDGQAASLLRETWSELQAKLGTNQPKCILVCDNLNEPQRLADQFAGLVGGTPWAGVSKFCRLDLPFDRARLEELARGKRGVGILAVCGEPEVKLQLVTGLESKPLPEDREEWTQEPLKRRYEEERERLVPRVSESLRGLDIPGAAPDHVVFLLEAHANLATSVFRDEVQSRLRGEAQVAEAGGWPASDGVAYFKGTVASNAVVLLGISGSLPLIADHAGMLQLAMQRRLATLSNAPGFDPERLRLMQARPLTRIVGGEAVTPVLELARSFGPHPLQMLVDYLGEHRIRFLQEAERVEVFQIDPGSPGAPRDTNAPSIEGFKIIAQGKTLGREAARELASALLTETALGSPAGEWGAHVAFRVSRGNESATVTSRLARGVAVLRFYDSNGKRTCGPLFLSVNLLHLAEQSLPAEAFKTPAGMRSN